MAAYDDDWGYDRDRWGPQPWASHTPGSRGDARALTGRHGWEFERSRRRGAGYAGGYDFGYQGGEFGRPVNARGFGTRASYGTPGRRDELDRDRGFPRYGGEYRPGEAPGAFRGRYSASRGYRRGRGTEYGADFSNPEGGSAWSGGPRTMSDDDVVEAVRETLFQDTYIDPERIEVRAQHGIVTLRGEVDDFLEVRYAWDDAWESPGVRGVINQISVRTTG